jgi:hypothetical protein
LGELWTLSWIGAKIPFELLWFPVLEKEVEDATTLKGNKEVEFLSWYSGFFEIDWDTVNVDREEEETAELDGERKGFY